MNVFFILPLPNEDRPIFLTILTYFILTLLSSALECVTPCHPVPRSCLPISFRRIRAVADERRFLFLSPLLSHSTCRASRFLASVIIISTFILGCALKFTFQNTYCGWITPLITTMTRNTSVTFELPPLPSYTLTPREPLLAPIPDNVLALILPIVAYWVLSMFYHFLDVNEYFVQYRLHTPAEVLKRNHVSRWEVVRDVILQQVIQTIAGMSMSYFDAEEVVGREEYDVAVWAQRLRIVQKAFPACWLWLESTRSVLPSRCR